MDSEESEPRKDLQPICVPFVLGFLLTYTQLRAVAAKWLSHEVLASCKDDYTLHFRVVDVVQAKKERCTFLRTTDNSGEPRCLWVLRVIPSFDGKRPKYRMPEASIQRVLNAFGFDTISPLLVGSLTLT
ncbi:hypothetical protein B0H17DRAFT_1192695 [Mycena rosella]|uniref:Uncharacterized protein n=1 Tax=Mycena rosella TaxID=1033263 RepID=A0AAD7M940_MYCRO|nr:hypothetical protein B0H17DRAFT_1192695 [Mycena rosella]